MAPVRGERPAAEGDAHALRADGGVALADRPAETLVDDALSAARLRRARRIAHLLDDSIKVPLVPYRIGFDAVAGLVPVVGDAVGSLVGLLVVWQAFRLGARKRTLALMLLYVAVDYLVGSLPFVGDILDATMKLNLRNVHRLERELARRD
ncbi:DUF4112 domain-containing protein [Halobaculum marinum]|uniref:DUF4112 domain-containing protein n=1 Tax=Halobaculum marinum TaxID=3031996 RepID=A0ABD5WW46_9EURY|nr:DUF4112 domain-containing protein [Halobaculum sp. DT55]